MGNISSIVWGLSYLDVIDPDHVSAGDGDSITTPDVFRVDVGEVDILNDNVLDAVGHVDTLALDDTGGALADQGLVGLDLDRVPGSLVISDGADSCGAGLVVLAPLKSKQALVIWRAKNGPLQKKKKKKCPLTLSLLMASWQPEAVP